MFQFISVFFLHYLVQVLVCSAINQYRFYIVLVFLEYFSSSFSFSKWIAIILVLVFVLVMKIALVAISFTIVISVAERLGTIWLPPGAKNARTLDIVVTYSSWLFFLYCRRLVYPSFLSSNYWTLSHSICVFHERDWARSAVLICNDGSGTR